MITKLRFTCVRKTELIEQNRVVLDPAVTEEKVLTHPWGKMMGDNSIDIRMQKDDPDFQKFSVGQDYELAIAEAEPLRQAEPDLNARGFVDDGKFDPNTEVQLGSAV